MCCLHLNIGMILVKFSSSVFKICVDQVKPVKLFSWFDLNEFRFTITLYRFLCLICSRGPGLTSLFDRQIILCAILGILQVVLCLLSSRVKLIGFRRIKKWIWFTSVSVTTAICQSRYSHLLFNIFIDPKTCCLQHPVTFWHANQLKHSTYWSGAAWVLALFYGEETDSLSLFSRSTITTR